MGKKLVAFRLDEESLKILKKLCEKNNRSQANMLEQLIREAGDKTKLRK